MNYTTAKYLEINRHGAHWKHTTHAVISLELYHMEHLK